MTVVSPGRTYVEPEVRVGAETVIEPGAMLSGDSRIGRGVRIRAGCVVENCRIEDGAHIRPYSILSGARVRKDAVVGPFAHLRPDSDIGEGAHIVNFVEVKKSRIGKGSKANHLSYIGDATVGREVNIGAGVITCNYDGFEKFRTVIEDGVFVGSDTQFVAPVTIGKGALVAAGATITRDVPADALAISRVPQAIREGFASRRRRLKQRKGTK